jgi:hypothetical protein
MPQDTKASHEDANLVLRLYEIRRDERMRQAREFMLRQYNAENMQEHRALCPRGSENDASFRMVVSYWDMACSFVTAGVLNQDLLLQSTGELLLVWTRLRNVIQPIRESLGDPRLWRSLEQVAKSEVVSLNTASPGAYEKRKETIWRINRPAAAQA